MKKKSGIIALSGLGVVTLLACSGSFHKKQQIFINEVRCWDASSKRYGYYGSDYIEIYNASNAAVDLSGWYASDDETDLKKSRIEGVVIEAGAWAILYANGEADSGDSLNFKLSAEGEKVFLSDANGNLVDSVYVPKQEFGTVYARVTDGADEWVIQEETTAATNNGAGIYPQRSLKAPVFSHESGFYDEAFTLTLEAQAGQTIYYTLDGSVPTEGSSVYEGGLLIENRSSEPNVINSVRNIRPDWQTYGPDETPVDKAVVVRAVAMDGDGQASAVVTKTYFVGLAQYETQNVLSIVTPFDALFGDEGIFVTGKAYDEAYLSGNLDGSIVPNISQKGRRWEVQGNLQLFENARETVDQTIGLRLKGASSRVSKKKRIGLYARKEYSGSPYISGLTLDGQEAHTAFLQTESPNALLGALVKDRQVEVQNASQATVFINGEYYYSGYLVELYSKYYFQDRCGVSADNLMVVKNNATELGPELSGKYYEQLVAQIRETDLSIPENYEELLTKMDMQSFIDFMCINAYVCNMDVAEHKNYMVWRTIEPENTQKGDGRWRWILYDIDSIAGNHRGDYGVETKSQINSFAEVMDTTGIALNKHPIFEAAKENEDFCRQFVLTFMDLANVNFSQENVAKVFAKWNTTLEEYDGFFRERFDYIVPYMAEEFELSGTLENVTLKVNDTKGGTIRINTTTPELSDGSWSGKYYTDYPVTVTALPAEGYEFAGWRGSVTSAEETVEAPVTEGGITLEAVFMKTK